MSGEARTMSAWVSAPPDFDPDHPKPEHLRDIKNRLGRKIAEGITDKLFEFNKLQLNSQSVGCWLDVLVPPTPREHQVHTREWARYNNSEPLNSDKPQHPIEQLLEAMAKLQETSQP